MKSILAVMTVMCLISGCMSQENVLDPATSLRKEILNAKSCSFETSISANYNENTYVFQMDCYSSSDTLRFSVTEPDTIGGITGSISDNCGSLTFDDKVLTFQIMADGRISPVCAPWVLIQTLRGGHITGCLDEGKGFVLSIEDTYSEDTLHLEIYTDSELTPYHADIYWHQDCIVSLEIRNFTLK